MDTKKLQNISKKMISIFLIGMLAFTILSRVLDSFTIAKVNIVNLKKSELTHSIKGTGKLESEEILSIPILQNMKIRKLLADPGQKIIVGDPLFKYQVEELQIEYEKLDIELQKQKLSLEEEILNNVSLPDISEQELASQSVEKANEILNKIQQQYQESEIEYKGKLEKINREYETNKNKKTEELLKELEAAYLTAEKAYATAELDQTEAIRNARWNLADAERELAEAIAVGVADPIEEARLKVVRREKEKDLVESRWELTIEQARVEKENKKKAYEAVRDGEDDGLKALQQEYEANIEKEKATLESAQDKQEQAERDYKDTLINNENAKKKDSNSATAEQRKKELSVLRQKAMKLTIEEKEKELLRIKNIIEADGIVNSSYEGSLVKLSLEPGQTTTGTEQVQIGAGKIQVRGSVSEDNSKYIKQGDEITLSTEGKAIDVLAVVKSVSVPEKDKDGVVMIELAEKNALLLGTEVTFKNTTKSSKFDKVIPMDALRKDNNGEYILIVQERDTILGKELFVVRVEVTVLEKTATQAAIECNLTSTDRIIEKSNKDIQNGDRVRVTE